MSGSKGFKRQGLKGEKTSADAGHRELSAMEVKYRKRPVLNLAENPEQEGEGKDREVEENKVH